MLFASFHIFHFTAIHPTEHSLKRTPMNLSVRIPVTGVSYQSLLFLRDKCSNMSLSVPQPSLVSEVH